MFEIEYYILDEGSWELAGCQISTIICLLGLKQIRLGIPKVPGPMHAGDEFSEHVTSLLKMHFNQKIHSPSGLVCSFLICFWYLLDVFFHLKWGNVEVYLQKILWHSWLVDNMGVICYHTQWGMHNLNL